MHANFFGYSHRDMLSIRNIKSLMPTYISSIHDVLIDNYLDRGHSPLLENSHFSFAVDKNGFLIPLSIHLSAVFNISDDFRMNAVLLKLPSEKEYIIIN